MIIYKRSKTKSFQSGGKISSAWEANPPRDPNAIKYGPGPQPNSLSNAWEANPPRDPNAMKYRGIAKPQIGGTGPIEGREGFYSGEDGRAFSYLHQPPNQMNLTGNPMDDISPITEAIRARNPNADIGTEGYYGPMYEAANRVYEAPDYERVTGIVPQPLTPPGGGIPTIDIPNIPPPEVVPETTPVERPKYKRPKGAGRERHGGVPWKQGQNTKGGNKWGGNRNRRYRGGKNGGLIY